MPRCTGTYDYHCSTLEGFVARVVKLASQDHYYFFKLQKLAESADPLELDEKILSKYEIRLSKDQRYRRKRKGIASLQYSRWERFYVVQATKGTHRWFQEEGTKLGASGEKVHLIRDVRVQGSHHAPLRVGGYSIAVLSDGGGKGSARVRIDNEQYQLLRASFLELALDRRWSVDALEAAIWNIDFEPYAGVYKQIRGLVAAMNGIRKTAGLEKLDPNCVRQRRNLVPHFSEPELGKNIRHGVKVLEQQQSAA